VLADVPGRLPRGHAVEYRGATCLWQRGTAHLDSWRSVCQWRRREPGGELWRTRRCPLRTWGRPHWGPRWSRHGRAVRAGCSTTYRRSHMYV